VNIWLWAIEWYGDYEHKRTKNNYGFLKMKKHSNIVAQKYKILSLGQANMNMQLVLKEWCNM
jgi:hypothetical protein